MSGWTRRATGRALGSCTVTVAPDRCAARATSRAGESRMSSLLGLKAAPSTATFLPISVPPHCSRARSTMRSEEHTSELQSRSDLVCRLLLEKKKKKIKKDQQSAKKAKKRQLEKTTDQL